VRLTSFYPVLCSSDVESARRFYTGLFDFEVTFATDWYVSLRRELDFPSELALLDHTHPTIPEAYRRPPQGVLLNPEVTDVDEEWERLAIREGLTVELGLRTEGFGQRHFIVAGPDGVLIDVITPIAPSPDYAGAFVGEVDT
jgi:catechol 2,3-dioxygenase-like lactoylglutathione lyase family enzyme